jgi:anti-sigma-K factor RskA
METVLKVLAARRIEIVTMAGLRAESAAYGSIFIDPQKKIAVLHVANLPILPQDKEYQLWLFKEQKKVSAGTFSLTEDWDKESFYTVTPFDVSERREIDSVAVTAEPKGGAAQPTGETYLLGKKPGF